MSTTAPKPATTPIPVQLSEPEFEAFILPHLSMPKRGPKCKLGYYRVFNLILWVLYTGMQWKCLPVPTDAHGTSDPLEFIPIHGLRCLRGQEAPSRAGGPCTGLQSCPPAFLVITRMTVDEVQHLIPSCEAALHAQRGVLLRPPSFPDAPPTLATDSLIGINSRTPAMGRASCHCIVM